MSDRYCGVYGCLYHGGPEHSHGGSPILRLEVCQECGCAYWHVAPSDRAEHLRLHHNGHGRLVPDVGETDAARYGLGPLPEERE